MVRYARWALVGALLLGWSTAAVHAREVRDEAGLFSATAKEKADADIAAIKNKFNKDLFVETKKQEPPANFATWAEKRAQEERVNGVYIVILTYGTKYRFAVVGSDSVRKNGL